MTTAHATRPCTYLSGCIKAREQKVATVCVARYRDGRVSCTFSRLYVLSARSAGSVSLTDPSRLEVHRKEMGARLSRMTSKPW